MRVFQRQVVAGEVAKNSNDEGILSNMASHLPRAVDRGTAPTDMRGTDPLDRLLRATSRTFALGIVLLRPPLRAQVRVAYLVLRVSDYLEDNRIMPPPEKVRLLRLWHRVLNRRAPVEELVAGLERQPEQDPIPDLQAARHADAIVAALDELDDDARDVIVTHAGQSTLGMARWVQRGPRFDDESDLDDYMHEVAGRVGHLLTELFAQRLRRVRRRRKDLMGLGREFGLALQTVNVIRGLSADRQRGWIFVPRSFLPPGMTPAALFAADNRGAAMDVLARLSDKAARHFGAAVEYVTLLPRTHARVRLFCQLPLFFGTRTLAASRGRPEVLTGEVKITRREVTTIARSARTFGASNAWVRWYANRLGGLRNG